METLLLEDDAKLEQARTRCARTICWATARMYRLSSGWEWQICFLHACGFRIMANTLTMHVCRCPVESQHWAKGPQTSYFWVRIRFAPLSSLGSKRARMAEVTKSPALKLLGWSYTCMTLHTCSSESSSFGISSFMRHVLYCLLAFVQLDLNRWVLTHPNVRGLEFPYNHMFGKQDHSLPEGRAGSLCSHVYIHTYIHTYILFYLHTLHVCIYIYKYKCLSTYISTYIHIYIHMSIDMYLYTHIYVYIHTYL